MKLFDSIFDASIDYGNFRYMIVNASYNANQVPSDKKSICQYVYVITLCLLWSIAWCILDTHDEWHLFPLLEFCLSKPYEFSLNSFLLFLVWIFPLIMFFKTTATLRGRLERPGDKPLWYKK